MNSLQPNTLSPRSTQPGSLCIANAQLVLPDRVMRGRVRVEDGMIVELAEGDAVPRGAVDCGGDIVLPGLVELHTDNVERHLEPRPKVDWPHLQALLAHDAELASTGITTVFDAMRVGSVHSGKAFSLDYARTLADELLAARAKGLFKISHFLHLRAEICSETLADEFATFSKDDRVGIVSLMDHTPGQRQFRDLSALKTYLSKKRGLTDAEFAEHVEHLITLRTRYGAKHEKASVAEAQRLGAVLASHDDTTAAQVATSAANGVTFAEFPTTVEAAEACRARGIAVMMGAPNLIRGGSHSGNVAASELAERDLLDIVSSDYIPAALLLSAFKLAHIWDDLPRAIATVSRNSAASAHLTDRGTLEVGLRGDILRVQQEGHIPLIRGVWSRGLQVA